MSTPTTNNTTQWNLDRLATDTVLLAAFTGYAYLTSFLYNWGFLSHYGLSPQLIQVDLASMLLTTVVLAVVMTSIFVVSFYIFFWNKEDKTAIEREVTQLIQVFFIIVVLPMIFFGFKETVKVATLAIIGFLLIRCISLFFTEGNTLEEKLLYQEKRRANEKDHIVDWLVSRIGRKWLRKSFWLLIFLYSSFEIGKSTAFRQDDYYIIEGEPELAIIAIYGDRIISMPINREKKTLQRKLYLLNTQIVAEKGKGMTLEKIGALALEK